jgi:hypothetical protein
MEDRIIEIALAGGYELSRSEVLGVMHSLNVDDPTDDDIYLWVLILSGSDMDDSIDWASVKREAILSDPALISLLEKNS